MAVAMAAPLGARRFPLPLPRRARARALARQPSAQLLVRYHRDGDVAARDELVERFIPLARDLALRYSYTDEPIDDLLQVACLGLIKAIDRFEPDRGTKFTSYAAPTILGELKRHFRDKGWALHVPRDLQERSLALSREAEALSKELGRSPTIRELADIARLQRRGGAGGERGGGQLRGRVARRAGVTRRRRGRRRCSTCSGTSDTSYELVESRDAIASTWQALPDLERKVVELRFMHDLTQREIGEQIGYSQMHVSRLLRRALSRLEDAAEAA